MATKKKIDPMELWPVDPTKLVGVMANIETVDGSRRRNARISAVHSRNIEVNGGADSWPVPFSFEVNGDGSDVIELAHVQRLELWALED